MKTRKNHCESGFTLIEVIVTFVLVAIVAAMMSSYFGTSITQSSVPIARLEASARLNKIMEQITAQYIQSPQWQPNTTYAPGAIILPTTRNRTGLQYKTTGGGTSGTKEPGTGTPPTPSWPLTMGGTVTDGTVSPVTWTTVWDSAHNSAINNGAAPTLVLNNRLASTAYAKNTIVYPDNGFQYICTTAGTSSGPAPPWPTTSGDTATDGTVTWQYIGPQPTLVLQTRIDAGVMDPDKTQAFGSDSVSYRVIENDFIKFNSSNIEVNINDTPTDPAYGWYLKVTIGHPSEATGERITTLFGRR